MDISGLITQQRQYFRSQATLPLACRMEALQKLQSAIKDNEQRIAAALKADLNKSEFESYMTETGQVYSELSFALKHLPRWVKPQKVRTPAVHFPARSFVLYEPYGVILIMSPWNYPFLLTMTPLIGALAAGNCAVLKPSAYSPHTSELLGELIASCFPPEYVAVVQGGRQENATLLEQRFDLIFFTGSVAVGKLVMEKAARNLTLVILELGGKSPCIIDKSANLSLAAKRVASGKLVNAGQTCIAPDYLLVQQEIKDEFVRCLQEQLRKMLGDNPLDNPDFPRIINEQHFNRLKSLLEGENIIWGGKAKGTEWIEPTLLDNVSSEAKVMQEEIFGPILPILTYDSLDEAIAFIVSREKPLALYLFTEDAEVEKRVLSSVSFGGGCINDTLLHIATPYMGFGGVGQSGMGAYHGRKSFEAFSHQKSIMKRATWFDLPVRYHPYQEKYLKLLKKILK